MGNQSQSKELSQKEKEEKEKESEIWSMKKNREKKKFINDWFIC